MLSVVLKIVTMRQKRSGKRGVAVMIDSDPTVEEREVCDGDPEEFRRAQ